MTATNQETEQTNYLAITADIISSYVANNSVRSADLESLISSVHSAIRGLSASSATPVQVELEQPAVPIKKSITQDFLICLEDGMKFKSLKRHLATMYKLTPEDYRSKWGLPRNYPMVAPAYAAARSALAKKSGLGVAARKKADEAAPQPSNRGRGRPQKEAA